MNVRERVMKVMLRVSLTLGIVFALTLLYIGWGKLTLAADPTGVGGTADVAIDYVWVLVCAFLVMFMQPGFAMLETGFCRAKNAVNITTKNIMDFIIGSLTFFLVGYALMMGNDWGGFIGTSGWLMLGDYYDVDAYLNMFWMLVFCATAATIVSGAVAERLKFKAYLVYSVVLSAIIYPLLGHWVWGGGWLANLPFGLGAIDFAGSGVVHALGGFMGLAGAIVLGPRFGRFTNGRKGGAISGHNMIIAALGVFILWFGWFGFNPGSTLSAHHTRIAIIAVNTNLAAATGGLIAFVFAKMRTGKWDTGMLLNGILAGLVAVTAPCAWIEGWAAIVIGFFAGLIMYGSVRMFEKMRIDDPVGAVSVHGVCGLWGLLSIGIFADGTYGNYAIEGPFATGLLYGGGFDQLIAQIILIAVVFVWSFGLGYITFKLMDKIFGIRVSPIEEMHGMDIIEHGAPAYPEQMQ